MRHPLVPPPVISVLIAVALVLPITICVVLGVSALFQAMGDSLGGSVLGWVALGLGILWAVNLICLVLLAAIHCLPESDDEPAESE